MSLKGDDRVLANSLRTRANGTNLSPSLGTTAIADARGKTINATGEAKENPTSPNMASNTHHKQPSTASLPGSGLFSSPDESRIPRPTSTPGQTRSREPLRMTEALKLAADRHRAIQGSPSPAPRLSRKTSSSSDVKPLRTMFSQEPIDLGRLGTNSTRRAGTLSSRDSFGSASRKGDESDDELDRKLRQFEEDEKIVKAMTEEKNASFVRRRAASNGIGSTTPIAARKAGAANFGTGSFGNGILGSNNYDGPRTTWGDKAKYDSNWLRQFQNQPDAAVAFHERVSGPKQNSSERDKIDTPARPATVGPSLHPEPFAWPVEDDFTAGDLQVSTSPPVSFGRANTKLDELRKLEIDVERKYPIANDLFAPRSNTRLDEIARLEREAARKYPVTNIEDSEPIAMADAQPPRGTHRLLSPSRIPFSKAETTQATNSLPTNATLAMKISEEATQQRSPLPEVQQKASPEVPQPPSPRSSQQTKDVPKPIDDIGNSDEQAITNPPVTTYSSTDPDKYINIRQQSTSTDVVTSGTSEKETDKDDAQDLLRRLARASSKSPRSSPVQDKAGSRSQTDQEAAPAPALNDKVAPIAKSSRTKGANKTGSPSKPTVGFIGISRSSSTNSMSSQRSSVESHDPTARIEAEADLFALDNQSERGSFRVPSPLSDSESEAEAEDKKDDNTPRPDKFDPAPMPTPLVTGAYIDTPATMKVERRDMNEDTNVSQPNLLPSRKSLTENRDPNASPRASKSDSHAGYMRRRSLRETRRSKSAPRYRSPLKNSAKLPTVKDDLRQICQKNDIDDSTLDDLTDLVVSSSNPEELVNILKSEEPNHEGAMAERAPAEQLKTLDRLLVSLRSAKKGIEKIENRVSHSEKQAKPAAKVPVSQHRHSHPTADPACPECATSKQTEVYTYMHIPVPRLYRTKPRFKLTFTGILMLLLCLWHLYWFVEDLFYDRWGKQEFCYRGSPCRWDVDDPEYGYVIPVKLDEWLTGGVVRPHAARWLEEAEDSWADFEDWWRGTDIQQVDHRIIRDSSKKAQYWRRINKKGLFPKWNPASWMLPQIEAWERETAVREEAEARAAMGYGDFEDVEEESMDKDQPIQSDATDESTNSWW